ncbi:MAG: hypothetical protein H7A34_01770 [bacterium]|nr:hypothetical protein [bacterium]
MNIWHEYGRNSSSVKKSLMQQVFETRLNIAESAIKTQQVTAFDLMVDLLVADVKSFAR